MLRATGGSILQLNGANGAFINNGLIEAVAGPDSLVQISGGVFTNNGSIRPDASSQVQLINNVNVMGGTLADAGRALHSVASTLTGVTNNGDLILDTGSSTTLVGTLTNNATVTFAGFGASYVTLQLSGNVTLAGPGTMTLDSFGYDYIYAVTAGDRLTVGAGQTIQGAGYIGNGGTTVTNRGTIIANQANALILQPGGGTGDFTNSASGVLRATGGSILRLNGANGAFINNGLFDVQNGSTMSVSSGALPNNQGVIHVTGGTFDTNNGVLTNDHEISGFGSFRTGGLTNKGTMAFTGGTATVNGSVTNNSNATITVASTTATFDSTLTNNGSYVSNVSTQNFTNLVVGPTGSITAGAGDVFNVLGNVTNNSTQNTAFDVSQAKFVMQGPGSHQFTWPGANTPDARAFAIGTLEVQSGGSATINLSGTGSGLIIGLLQIDNGATVIFGDGMALAGDPGGVGKFDAGFGSVGGGRVGHLASPATVPEPGAIGLLFAGAAGLLTRRRRR